MGAVALAVAFAAGCGGAATLPLRRIVLYQNGIGYFERTGTLAGDELRIGFMPHEADDALKTLTVVETGRARAGAGESLAISAVVPQPPRPQGDAADRADESVTLTVRFSRPPSKGLLVAYAVPTPTWRAVYRMVLPEGRDAGQGLLQAWALVNNVSDEDWVDVDMSLATSAPFTYAVDLRTPRFVPRPDVTGRLVEPSAISVVRAEESRAPSGDDGDGVAADDDLCPAEPEDVDQFEDADGCPDPDNDRDRIRDAADECPSEPENYNGFDDDDGCPDHGRVEVVSSNIVIMDRVYFRSGSAEISDASAPILDAIAATLRGNPDLTRVEVEGHAADDEPDPWGLSAERAGAVKRRLVETGGVQEERLHVRPFGATQPVDPGTTAAARERNRRVEFRVAETPSGAGGAPPEPVTAEAVQRSAGPAAAAAEAIGGTVYHLGRQAVVPAASSALITLVNREVRAEDVLLFRPDDSAPGSDRHPLRAARFANESGFDLVAGPLELFAGGAFLGEGMMDPVSSGDVATVPYALDRSTWIAADTATTVEPRRILALARGVLVVEDAQLRRTRYQIDAGPNAPGRVFLAHRRTSGFEPVDLPPGTETTPDGLLVPLPLVPGRHSVITVTESRPEQRSIDLLEDQRALVAAYLDAGGVEEATARQLRRAVELRAQMNEVEDRSAALREQLGDLGARAVEIRESLRATEAERRATGDLRRRLLERLEQATEAREGLTRDLVELTARRATLREELTEALESLVIEERREP
jgi:outer membrane protein OmpA-like peptidoglycan-associated protein